MFNLTGKVAIITGGSRGIGEAISETFAKMGCSVVIAARSLDQAEKTAQLIESKHRRPTLAICVDVRDQGQVTTMVEKTVSLFGRIDILVNNAGVNIRKLPQDITIDDWNTVIDTNLRGTFLCSRAVYKAMKYQGGGKIINIGSLASLFGGANVAPYAASKGGVVQLTKSFAAAWASDNIQVNAILPGWICTDLTVQARKDIPGLLQAVIERTPAGRWGVPQDIGGTALFLASAASNFVTGAAIPVDGGFSVVYC